LLLPFLLDLGVNRDLILITIRPYNRQYNKEFYMAQVSKNARIGSAAHKHDCPCGGEVKMKSVFTSGKMRNMAVCEKCNRRERRPRDFR